MKVLQKGVSVLLTLAIFCALCVPAGAAAADPLFEECIVFTGTDDGEVLYLRMGSSIYGVSDSLQITLLPGEEDDWQPPVIDFADVIVELPGEENGNRVELFVPLDCEYVPASARVRVDGLLQTGNSEPVGCTIEEQGTKDPGALQIHYPDEEITACINHYSEQEGQDFVIYCLEGDVLEFTTKWDQLRNRLSASCDGLQVRAADDGSPRYTAVSGAGTLTLHVMRHVRYSSKVCVMTEKERRALLVRSAARNPKQRLSAWLEILVMAPTMWLFPISLIFIPVFAPFAALASPFACGVELLYMLLTGRPMQMMR